MTEAVAFKLKHLPDSPGCYLMKHEGQIIYVGKAKNLKNRVRQYFHPNKQHTPKVLAMVERIDDFETVLVDSELEALMLECNLIKLHKPYYNILLKDDKHYPYLAFDESEDFPPLEMRRKQEKDDLRYFGPFPGATMALELVRSLFPLRRCAHPTERGCMYAETGQCMAPCKGKCTREEYHQMLKEMSDFLSGKSDKVIRDLKTRMMDAAMNLNYELAAELRDRIRAAEQLTQSQKAILTEGGDMDAVALLVQEEEALVQMLYVRGGKILGSEHFTLSLSGDETESEIMTSFLLQWYGDAKDIPKMLLVSALPDDPDTMEALLSECRGAKVELRIPQRGEKKQLMDMALKNIRDIAQKRAEKLLKSYQRTTGALEELAQVLGMDEPPRRIEGYDISNTQGAQSVGAMVVMIDGVAAKKQYRQFNIKTVQGPNDFASMHEVIARRFRHGLDELKEIQEKGGNPLEGRFSDMPDLILIDGGVGQLKEAMAAMREEGGNVPMFGLAERVDEIVLPYSDETILLDRHSDALHLIERLRDEAHRFGITRHRKLRQKVSVRSQLDNIEGIGPKKKQSLIKHFRTVEAVKNATMEELCKADGISTKLAEVIYTHFHAKSE